MVNLMWKKCSKSSEEERRMKGPLNLCISGGIGNGCGGRVSVSAPVGFFFLCVFCLVCQCLLTEDYPSNNPQWSSPQFKSTPCCSRNLSEVILRQLEKYIDLSDTKLLERKINLRGPPINDTPKKEEKIELLRKEHEKSTNEDSDIQDIESTDAEVKAKEEGKNKINDELKYENQTGKELTEEEFEEMVGILRGYIDIKDMYALWDYVHRNGKKKYVSLKEELLKDCENLSIRYNIPEDFATKEWRKAYLHLKEEFRKKQRDDYVDLKVFIDGLNLRWEFIAFIIQKDESWDFFADAMKDKWEKSLSKSFEKYVEDAQEKEIEKHPKTGATVSCNNNNNEQNIIIVTEILQ